MLHEGPHRGPHLSRLATTTRSATIDPRNAAMLLLGLLLFYAAALTMWPFASALILAAWSAHLSRSLFVRLRGALGGRARAASLLTAVFVMVVLTPLALALAMLVPAGKSLLEQLRGASGGRDILTMLVGGTPGVPIEGKSIIALAREYGASASRALSFVARASASAIVAAFVFFTVFYTLLVDGERWFVWTRAHAPLPSGVFDRLTGAFYEAGRGLLVGTGLTALLQGGITTILFMAFGIPTALLLGMLSVVAALVPMAGPMIVWVPVTIGLALTGQLAKAAALAALCAGIVGTIDNLVRPWLSRRFKVGMPATVVLVAMLGGVVAFGGWGLFLGPLLVRLAGEMLEVSRSRRMFGRESPELRRPAS